MSQLGCSGTWGCILSTALHSAEGKSCLLALLFLFLCEQEMFAHRGGRALSAQPDTLTSRLQGHIALSWV